MPTKPLHACTYPRCANLTDGRFCSAHPQSVVTQRPSEAERPTAAARGYGRTWQKAREGFLAKHPLCAIKGPHCRLGATLVDHITPHKGDMTLFWDRSNWQSSCAPCHSEKTAREDGGFGNQRRITA